MIFLSWFAPEITNNIISPGLFPFESSLHTIYRYCVFVLLIVLMMEKKLRQGRCLGQLGNYSNRACPSMHKHSQTISKSSNNPPKIRIIHIFAPEIIKTDAANFRELVQRLTGKPSSSEKHSKKKKPTLIARDHHQDESHKPRNIIDQSKERVVMKKEQVGLCCNINDHVINSSSCGSSGGYLGGFSDLEGFISELAQFPLLPLDFDDSHFHAFEQQPHL